MIYLSGDYGEATIQLDNNLLTKFESNAFLEVLDEMNRSGGSGIVSIANNGKRFIYLINTNRRIMLESKVITC